MEKPVGNCKHCGLPLRSFGNARKKGKCHNDWASRQYHKKCWAKNINNNYEKIKKFIELYNDE
jgi:hypothetical protein